ncbi:MAG: hypothetical protein ACI4VE_05580 [Clostridia bacterium]
MEVKCISTCQLNREKVFVEGKNYDIPKEMYEKNKVFFEAVKNKTSKNNDKTE